MDNDLHDPRTLAASDAASWYVLMESAELRSKPVGVGGPGDPLVVWRGRGGRPVAFHRYCPHHGADLALGSVQDGCELRCCFHGWRFDDRGQCSFIPDSERIPVGAHRRLRHVEERYGLVWIWHGSPEPLFPLPKVPEFEASQYAGGRTDRVTRNVGTVAVTRVIENPLDTVHISGLHRIAGKVGMRVLDKPCWEPDDYRWPTYFDDAAWFGTELELQQGKVDRFGLIDRVAATLGFPIGKVRIVNDVWPSGSVQRVFLGKRHLHTLLSTASPFSPLSKGESVGHRVYVINSTVPQGNALKTAIGHLITASQTRVLLGQDVTVWRGIGETPPAVLVKDDAPIIAFRRWYADWVTTSTASPSSKLDASDEMESRHR